MAGSVIAEFMAKMEEFEERRARQHNEIMTSLRALAVSRGCDVSDWPSSAGVDGVEGTQSDTGGETKVVVKTSVSLLTKHPMVTQVVPASGINMPLPTSKVFLQEDVKQDLGPKHVVLDPVLVNQKEQSIIQELGCKSVRTTVESRDLEDNSGGGFGSYNSLDVWWLVSDDKTGIVHGCHSMTENINLNGKGHLIDHSGIFWPSNHVIIGFGSREVYYGDDYPWDPGIT